MDKHLTEIELFEFSNQLIEDKEQKEAIKKHISSCKSCASKVLLENKIDLSIKENLKVKQQVNLNAKIADYFTQDKPNYIGLDTKGVIYTILFLSGLMMLTKIPELNVNIPYMSVLFSSIVGLLLIELVYKYRKYKRSLTS